MSDAKKLRVILAGGGTGGHLFPGMAVMDELRRRAPHLEVLHVGTERGIEARVVPARGGRIELMDVTPLKGRSAGQLLKSVGRLPAAVRQARGIVRAFEPDLVLGVGGYASGPMVLGASTLKVPTAVLEQNAHVGLTNRILSKRVGRAYVTFEETVERFGEHRARLVGNPVRREFVEMARRAATDPVGFDARANTVLVMGGSQGARALNLNVPQALVQAGVVERGLKIVHQTGAAMRDEVEASYRELGLGPEQVTVTSFIDDMARAFASAQLLVARAGASTLAELCAVGRPAVLIPFPYAADDHQGKNAESLQASGAAVCIREDVLTPEGLAAEVAGILDDDERRKQMSDAARALGRPDAAATIVDDLCEWLGWSFQDSGAPAGAAGDADPGAEHGSNGTGLTTAGLSMSGPAITTLRMRSGAYVPRARMD